jgi:hypothetical protein
MCKKSRWGLFATGLFMILVVGAFMWVVARATANRAMAQEQRAAAQAAEEQARDRAAADADKAAKLAAVEAAKAREGAQKSQAATESIEANNAVTRGQLAERMEVTFERQPLAGVLDFLANQLEIEVHAQRGDIEAAGVSLDAPVSLKFRRVRGEMLLELALRQVSPELSYVIRDGIVIVGTRGALSDSQVVRVYNCRELIAAAAKATSTVPAAPMGGIGGVPPGANTGAPMPGGAGMLPGGPGLGGFLGEVPLTPAGQLQQVIRATIAPESWDLNGGAGTMEEFGGLLVVNQSEAVHERVEKLLQMLHEAAEK